MPTGAELAASIPTAQPIAPETRAAARRVICGMSRDADEARRFLAMLRLDEEGE